jgi:small ligand-binding sensory domain FIST
VLALGGGLSARRFFVPLTRGHAEDVADSIVDTIGEVRGSDGVLFLFGDTYNLEPEPVFRGLRRRLPGVAVVGGGASEDGTVGEVSVFCGDTSSSGAVAGALVEGDVRATVGVTHALRRASPVHRVTAARGNWVLALDDRPAYEVFAAAVPSPLLKDTRRALVVVLAGLLMDGDEFVARHLVALDAERGALAVAAPVTEGQRMFFGVRDPLGAREDLQRVLADQAAAWRTPAASAALYVTCVGRGRGFYGVPGLESAYLRQHLGTLPVAGFFSSAEYGPGAGGTSLHQYTGVLTMLGVGT